MGATKRVLRRLDGVRLDLTVDGVDTITGRLPVLVVSGPGEVVPELAEALGIEGTSRFDPSEPPVFARTVKERFRIVPCEGVAGLELHHARRGPLQVWPADPRVVAEVTFSGQALLVLRVGEVSGAAGAGEVAGTQVHAAWIDVLAEHPGRD
ncbi:hypothetical protein LQF12_01305 [Ruania suaedae]|uniref:hypothetical protein n=1 Tax=Ruania suaedae TaxID=2897774 RepID=UPI001E4218CE|nr:hypothetical protein [Ruania suaedae]UFU03279.1 hypothetical protein LQF12_01305 [Ruania suaedae]